MYMYAVINVGLMILSILLQRRAFMVFGALTLVGLAIMYAGIQYHRHHGASGRFSQKRESCVRLWAC